MDALLDFPGAGVGRARFAFRQPQSVLQAWQIKEVPAVIAQAQDLARKGAWVLGFVAYEAAPVFDAAMPVREAAQAMPLAFFAAYERSNPDPGPAPRGRVAAGPWHWQTSRAQAVEEIGTIRAAIAQGRMYQVNLTTRLRTDFRGDARRLFDALRRAQPDGYCLYLDAGDWKVLSVSPELFFDWSPDGLLTTRPMKGTAARYADPVSDRRSREAMLASEKERAENLMIVDLLRNDMGRIAQLGSVCVPSMFDVAALPTAWQMSSKIECRTVAGASLPDIFGALFPCGSITGAPKIAAMALIRDLESAARGAYCGAIGVIRPGGHATFNVGIRTVTIDATQGIAECGVGSGITSGSSAREEYAEWQIKQRFLQRATKPCDRRAPSRP